MPNQGVQTARMADMYRFLSLSMQYPHASWFTDEYLSTLYILLGELGWHEDVAVLRHLFEADGNRIEPLQIEHTRLFINAVPHVVAPPYGSVYLSPEGTVYGASTVETKAFYHKHGFALASESEIPDYLVCELEFLATLVDRDQIEEEKKFLQTLFRPWFEIFRDKVLEESQHPFYAVLVKLIDFFTS